MIQQNSVPVRARNGSTLPAAVLLLAVTSIVTIGEICLEAELQQIVESALAPRPQPAPHAVAAPGERDPSADVMAPVTSSPPVQRATGIRIVEGTARRDERGGAR